MAEYQKAFDLLDKDKNGTISARELGEAMRSTGLNPSKEELRKMIKSVDVDENGKLNLIEFQTLMIREVKKSEIESLRGVFSSYDKDGDGSITVKEAFAVLKAGGMQEEDIEKTIKQMFGDTDFDKDDKLIFEGW